MSGSNRKWIGAVLGWTMILTGCGRHEAASPQSVLRLSQRNEPGDLDPATANLPDEFFIIRALSEGLVTPAPDGGAPLPAAAQSWAVSTDGLRYTFHLRPGATWSNREPVTAADFIASYRRVLTPATAAPKAGLFFLVRHAEDFYRGRITDFSAVGFRAPDAATLEVTLAHPAPQFPAYAASGPWIPVNPRVVARFGQAWTQPGNFVGNGPFTLTAWKPNQHIIVRRRPDYWDAAHVLVDAVHFLAFDNGDAEERAFRAGQIDITMAVPFSKIAGYAAQQPSPLRQIPLHETRYLTFNTTRAPLNDLRVRRALALALDRNAIVNRVLRGGQHAAAHFVPDGLGGFKSVHALSANAADARRLLAAAGFPGGHGFPSLELSGWTQTPVLEAVQAMWRQQLGITCHIVVRDAKVHVAALHAGDYDIGFITAIPDVADPADLLKNFLSGAPGNYPQWRDPAYDTLFARADATARAASRLALLAQAEARLTAQCPLTPLYFNAKNILQRSTVHGWREDALWTRFYKGVSVSPTPR
jgi:oligopeptide transport system substrate-binding protein